MSVDEIFLWEKKRILAFIRVLFLNLYSPPQEQIFLRHRRLVFDVSRQFHVFSNEVVGTFTGIKKPLPF